MVFKTLGTLSPIPLAGAQPLHPVAAKPLARGKAPMDTKKDVPKDILF